MTAPASRRSLPTYNEGECPSPIEQIKGAGETPMFTEARHREGFLKACRTEIIGLPHQKFVDRWRESFQPTLSKLPIANASARKIAETLYKERSSYEERFRIVVCTTVGSHSKLPEFSIRTRIPEGAERLPDSTVYLTKEAREQYAAMKQSPIESREKFEGLKNALRDCTDLLPSRYTRGTCLAQAMIKTDLLALCGIPRKNLQHRYVCLPSELRSGVYGPVDFHCSPRVQLADGTWPNVDSDTDSFQGIGYRNWNWVTVFWNMTTAVLQEDFRKIVPAGQLHSFAIHEDRVTSFTLPTDMILKKLATQEVTIGPMTSQERDIAGKKLARDRVKIEQELMLPKA